MKRKIIISIRDDALLAESLVPVDGVHVVQINDVTNPEAHALSVRTYDRQRVAEARNGDKDGLAILVGVQVIDLISSWSES